MTTVRNTLARAGEAHGSTLLISGEAGVGKSRMVRATIEHARELGFAALEGACFEADRAMPYAPLLDLVRVLSATLSASMAAHYLAPAAPELLALFPELHVVFPEATPAPARDPDEIRRRLHHALANAIHSLSVVQPVLLVFEDVHWSDDATLDLLHALARQLSMHRVAMLLVFRNDEIESGLAKLLADLDRARCASDVSLLALSAAECADMLRAIFGEHGTFDHQFVVKLHEVTGGNPFFVEEMLKALVVSGDLAHTNNAWHARPLDQVPVPRSATEAVGRRLSGLSAVAREIASVAAVAGRRFDFGLVQAVTGHDERAVLGAMKELVSAQIVLEETADRFAFRHALSRESLRSQLLARERIVMHGAIANALEQQYGDRTDDVSDALAYHTFEAGAWNTAVHYALRAANHAVNLGAPREALLQFNRAVKATQHAGLAVPPSLLLARGRAQETLGEFSLAHDDFEAAYAAAIATGERRAEWESRYAAGLLWAARDYAKAGVYRQEALDVARAIGDSILIAKSLNRVGNWYVNREDIATGIPYHVEAQSQFELVDNVQGVAETVDLLAMAHHMNGAQHLAVPLYERSVELFTTLDNRRGLANALSVLGVCGPSFHASAGPVTASAHLPDILERERAVQIASNIGWRAGEAFARYLVADCLAWRGEFRRARERATQSLHIAEVIAHREWQCGARRTLGFIACDIGDVNEGIQQHAQAHDVARQLHSATWIRWTGAAYATALVKSGQWELALTVLNDIDTLVPPSPERDNARAETRPTMGESGLYIARAELALATGDPAQALLLIERIPVAGVPRIALLRARIFGTLEQWENAMASLVMAHADADVQHAWSLRWQIEAAMGAVFLGQRRRRDARRSFDSARTHASELANDLTDAATVSMFNVMVDALAPPASARTSAQKAKAKYGGLTKRERDTASLVGNGKSNRAIAKTLGISERTVEGYVAGALSKLNFASRAQLAVWAANRGLVP